MKDSDPGARIFTLFNEIGIINQLATSRFARVLAPDLNPSEFSVLNHCVRRFEERFDELALALNGLTQELATRLSELRQERDGVQALIDCMAEGVLDIVAMKEIVWNKGEELGAAFDVQDIRPELQELANEWREKLIETVVEMDEEAMEAYFEGTEPSLEKLKELIRKGTLSNAFVPITWLRKEPWASKWATLIPTPAFFSF